MRRLRSSIPFVVMLFAVAASPAAAQSDFTPLTAEAYELWQRCSDAANAGAPAQGITRCQADIATIEALQAQNPNALPWEKDFTWLMSAGMHLALSGAYGDADGVLLVRVCDETERWWFQLGNITPGSDFDQRGSAEDQALVRRCRNEQGTPSWARPLP